jgi:hypothetical protein
MHRAVIAKLACWVKATILAFPSGLGLTLFVGGEHECQHATTRLTRLAGLGTSYPPSSQLSSHSWQPADGSILRAAVRPLHTDLQSLGGGMRSIEQESVVCCASQKSYGFLN